MALAAPAGSALTDGLHLVDAVLLAQRVVGEEELVQHGHDLVGLHLLADGGEAHDVGEEHGHALVPLLVGHLAAGGGGSGGAPAHRRPKVRRRRHLAAGRHNVVGHRAAHAAVRPIQQENGLLQRRAVDVQRRDGGQPVQQLPPLQVLRHLHRQDVVQHVVARLHLVQADLLPSSGGVWVLLVVDGGRGEMKARG